jgi:hypothetical protein
MLLQVSQASQVAHSVAEVDLTGYAEYHCLAVKFSSGVTLKELSSIAELVASFAAIPSPSRSAKRNFRLMMYWFKMNWLAVEPWLALVQLRDQDMQVIDSSRELKEKGKSIFPLGV